MAEEIVETSEAEEETPSLDEGVDDETLDNMSLEDVESLIEEQVKEGEESPEEPAEEPEPEEKPDPEEEPEPEPETEPEKAGEEKPEEEKPPTAEEEAAKLKEENAGLREKVERQGAQLGRWSNEVGELRRLQKVVEETKQTDEEFAQGLEGTPAEAREAIRKEQEHLAAKAESEKLETSTQRDECERKVRGLVPDFDDRLDEIAEIAKTRYDLEDWAVEELKKNPFGFDSREILDIARDVKVNRLEKMLAAGQAEKTKPKGGDESVTEKINKASKKPPRVGGSGQGAEGKSSTDLTEGDLSDAQIDGMDDKALSKLLKERGVPIDS